MSTQVVEKIGEEVAQWVTFRLEDEIYGINVMQVQEVLRMTDIAPVPGAPGFVLGIINLRGNVVTIIDLRRRIKLPPTVPTEHTRILIVETHGLAIGLMVDSIAEVVNLQREDVDSAPSAGNDESKRYIQGVYSTDEELIILLELDKLIDSELLGDQY